MEANGLNCKMKTTFLLILFMVSASGRIHKLNLEDDSRKEITLSTFGFLKGGTLAVNITNFEMKVGRQHNGTLFGFTLDKSKSSGLSSYMEEMRETCILNNTNFKNEKEDLESVFFSFDFNTKRVTVRRVGSDMQKLVVSSQSRQNFLIAHNLHRRHSEHDDDDVDDEASKDQLNAKLSDNYLMGSRRQIRALVSNPPSPPKPASPEKNEDEKTANTVSKTPSAEEDKDSNPPLQTGQTKKPDSAGSTAQPPQPSVPKISPSPSVGASPGLPDDTGASKEEKPTAEEGGEKDKEGKVSKTAEDDKEKEEKEASEAELKYVDLKMTEEGAYQAYFLVYIQRPVEEGLYNLFFHNCLSYNTDSPASITMTVEITEDNNGNFLTAGEMPVPGLYFTFTVLFFIAGVAWFSVLRKSEQDVFKIHYLMMVVVFVKSLACLFHGVNMYFIQIYGIHEDAWAVMWYIVYLTRGALMFVTVLLIGAGWAFIKHVLTDREKKLFLIVIPLQVLDRVAEVIVEESEEGNQSYMTWKEIFFLVDLICCGAILFPVVWSIRHLQEASHTDGKAAINLQKLKLFRHFYILVVCYVYFTRIIVYLMKITLPFKLIWLTDLFRELAVMVFFVVTGAKFRPATDNPYLQVPLDSDDEEEIEMDEVINQNVQALNFKVPLDNEEEEEEIEMDEVLTKTGSTETLVRVNQKTEGATNSQVKMRESSHDYD